MSVSVSLSPGYTFAYTKGSPIEIWARGQGVKSTLMARTQVRREHETLYYMKPTTKGSRTWSLHNAPMVRKGR